MLLYTITPGHEAIKSDSAKLLEVFKGQFAALADEWHQFVEYAELGRLRQWWYHWAVPVEGIPV